jgi:rhamnosyltransferase
MSKLSVGILIPTFQAAKHLPFCLPPLLQSPLQPKILIIDSSSTDKTVEMATSMGVESLIIPKREFNHGSTREKGRKLLGTDIVVMLTQDAYATSPHMLETLIQPLISGKASIAYARQLPHDGAGLLASFAREFNYPPSSHVRRLEDAAEYGAYTFFCSNSCAAYLTSALDKVGGFPCVPFGEDTVVVAKLLQQGHRIAYVAEAEVKHSHDYTLKEEFKRHYIMGMARQSQRELLEAGGKDSKRGKKFVFSMLKMLKEKQPSLIPYALFQTGAKFLGYLLGKSSILINKK